MVFYIESDKAIAGIKQYGAELTSFKSKVTGTEYLWQSFPEIWYGQSPVLFPIVGTLLNDKYLVDGKEYELFRHGIARKRDFELKEQGKDYVILTQKYNEDTLKVYPYKYVLDIEFRLDGEKLTATHTVKNEDVWYAQGKYVFTDSSITYDATNNQVSINASDLVAKLNDTVNGSLGQQIIEYPAYEENEETGEVIKYNLIRDAVITTVTQLGRVNPNDVFVDDIGEYKAMPMKNADWENYRKSSPQWNAIPYDLEFSSGCSVWSIIQELIGLYPDYEAYFDENAKFHVGMIPDCDDTYFENGFLNDVLISENTSIDFTAVRNITEVWGEAVGEMEFFAESDVGYTDNVYTASIGGYDERYFNGDTCIKDTSNK